MFPPVYTHVVETYQTVPFILLFAVNQLQSQKTKIRGFILPFPQPLYTGEIKTSSPYKPKGPWTKNQQSIFRKLGKELYSLGVNNIARLPSTYSSKWDTGGTQIMSGQRNDATKTLYCHQQNSSGMKVTQYSP